MLAGTIWDRYRNPNKLQGIILTTLFILATYYILFPWSLGAGAYAALILFIPVAGLAVLGQYFLGPIYHTFSLFFLGIFFVLELAYLNAIALIVAKIIEKSGNNRVLIGILIVAYLGLFILPGFQGTSERRNSESVINSALKEVHSMGIGVSQPRKITLYESSTLTLNEVLDGMTLSEADVAFFIADGSVLPTETDGRKVVVTNKTEAYFVTCGNEMKKTLPKYCIVFSNSAAGATNYCISKCEIE